MKIKTLPAAALGLALALALTACTASVQASSQPSGSVSASADTSSDAPKVDRDPQGTLPSITFDSKGVPAMAKIASAAPTVISVKTLTAGTGKVVGASDYVKVNYAGFLWSDGTKFDSSYGTGKTASFALSQVIEGWKYGLAGTKVGDRVMIIIPPAYGYGDQKQDAIPANSTLVFVADILDTTTVTTEALTAATPTKATLPAGITVTGKLGQEPTLVIAKDAAEPTKQEAIVLAEGAGAVITKTDSLLYHIVSGKWGGETSSSWTSSYQQVDSGGGEATVGKRVGSRIVLLYPADKTNKTAAQAYVIDILMAVPNE